MPLQKYSCEGCGLTFHTFENCEDHESRCPDVNKRSELEEYRNQINTAVEV